MAVNLKANGYAALELLGVDAKLIKEAKKYGITADLGLTYLTFASDNGYVELGKVKVTAKAINLLKENLLGPASKEALREQCAHLLSSILSNMSSSDAVGASATWQEKLAAAPANEIGSADDAPVENFKEPVKLAAADQVYQPVFGTSKGSVYYVVAMLDGANVAVRKKGNKLSIRVEGSKLANYKVNLAAAGFKSDAEYASAHFEVDSLDLATKTVGAVLGRIGLHNMKCVADLTKVSGWL